jgi:ribosomal protein S18 acetylase RimI-like enzyme
MFAIAPTDPDSPDARTLLTELGAALAGITGSDGSASFDPADVRGPRACFLVARAHDGSPAGCGALRPLAVAFYERHGYRVIPNFGKYAGRAEAVCLGKPVAWTAGADEASGR